MKQQKSSLHIFIDKDILEKSRDMVYWKPGYTLAQYIEELLDKKIKEYELKHGPIDPAEDSGINAPRKKSSSSN